MVLDTAKGKQVNFDNDRPDTREYDVFDLNQHMGEGDTWNGEPYLTEIYPSDEYDPSGLLYISNHENEEKLRARVKVKNQKNENDPVKFHEGSVGFDLIRTFKELDGEVVGDVNQFEINYKDLQEYVNSLDEITVKVIYHESKTKDKKTGKPITIDWKTLEVTKIGA
jgi:hypothetical protein